MEREEEEGMRENIKKVEQGKGMKNKEEKEEQRKEETRK